MASDLGAFALGAGAGFLGGAGEQRLADQEAAHEQKVMGDAYAEVLSPEQISADAQTLQDLYRIYGLTPGGGGQGQF